MEKEKLSLTEVAELSPAFKQLLEKRGFSSPELIQKFLHPSLDHLNDPFQMKGIREAADRLRLAMERQEKVLVHGDYDADGITGAAVTAKMLEVLQIPHELFLPNREADGYGVSLRPINQAKEKSLKILITVDCGISAEAEIQAARDLGLDVIVIDHHEIPEKGLPPASIIINPHQKDCQYPFGGLSAAGLAFKLAQAMLGEKAYEFLDLAAVSTVCDVAPLREENRIIVKEGLERMTKGHHLGLRVLAETSGVRDAKINTGHLGFVLGPRINAAGRMSSPEIALRLLVTPNVKEAHSLAAVLEEENRNRQREERDMLRDAISIVERSFNFKTEKVIVLARQGWHAGVIGIVAARLVEKYSRPAIVIALDGPTGKGSGRSLKGFALHEAFQYCAAELEQFGGHAQAAGLSVREDKVEAFRKKINEFAAALDPSVFTRTIQTDLELQLQDLTPQFLAELESLEPHGMGNPRPTFLFEKVRVKGSATWLGAQTLKFFVTNGTHVFEAHWTDRANPPDAQGIREGAVLTLAASVKTKTWKGIEAVSLEVKHVQI